MRFILKICNLILNQQKWPQAVMLLLVRIWIARVFFVSGLVKIADFNKTVELFKSEYTVPILPPVIAAVSSTVFELTCPVLLTIGLASRLAALPLLAMTAVIQFTYDQSIEHAYWAMLLGIVLSFGPGIFSLDQLIKRRFSGN